MQSQALRGVCVVHDRAAQQVLNRADGVAPRILGAKLGTRQGFGDRVQLGPVLPQRESEPVGFLSVVGEGTPRRARLVYAVHA